MSSSQMVIRGEQGGEPLLAIASRNTGSLRRAFKVLTFMAAWDRARRAVRTQALTLDEYAEWWRVPARTAFREQAEFREAFPGETTPDRLLDLAEGQWAERQGIKGLGQVLA